MAPLLNPSQPLRLRNKTCPYCGRELQDGAAAEDHVIGRRFVPKGKLEAKWNLIVRCCDPCNNIKSDLEDDLSAIAMQPDAAGRYAREDSVLEAEARRKAANSFSRRTGARVRESAESIRLVGDPMPGLRVEFNLVSAPQADEARVYLLACYQLSAFFYLLTFQENESRGYFWKGEYRPLQFAPRTDWGNPIALAFMRQIKAWQHRLLVATADGYFRAVIRKHPEGALCWAFALEWNHNIRTIGYFGAPEAIALANKEFPTLEKKILKNSDGVVLRYWEEAPLADADDLLFGEEGFPLA